MLIVSIDANQEGFHSRQEQPWRNEVWEDGYARVPEELREVVLACMGYCDLVSKEEKYEYIIEPEHEGIIQEEYVDDDGMIIPAQYGLIPAVTEPRTQMVVTQVISKGPPPLPEPEPDPVAAQITNIQLALCEIYEQMLGGGF